MKACVVVSKVKENNTKNKLGGEGMVFKAVKADDNIVVREGRDYKVYTETLNNHTYRYIVNDANIRVPLKYLHEYVDNGVLVELVVK